MYEGDWLDGKRHGFGVLSKISENGTLRQRYTGDWVAGKKNGFGRSWYEDGSYYEGDFCQNKRQGYGRIWYCNGDYYEGTWFNNLYDGMGMFVKGFSILFHLLMTFHMINNTTFESKCRES